MPIPFRTFSDFYQPPTAADEFRTQLLQNQAQQAKNEMDFASALKNEASLGRMQPQAPLSPAMASAYPMQAMAYEQEREKLTQTRMKSLGDQLDKMFYIKSLGAKPEEEEKYFNSLLGDASIFKGMDLKDLQIDKETGGLTSNAKEINSAVGLNESQRLIYVPGKGFTVREKKAPTVRQIGGMTQQWDPQTQQWDVIGGPARTPRATGHATGQPGGAPAGHATGAPTGQAAGGLSPEALEMQAQAYLDTGRLPSMGYGRAAQGVRQQIMNKAAEQTGGGSIAGAQMMYKGDAAALSKVRNTEALTQGFEETVKSYIPRLREMRGDLALSPFRKVAQWEYALKKDIIGDPKAQAMHTLLYETLVDYGKVVSGQFGVGGLTEGARKEAQGLLDAASNPAAFNKVLDTMEWSMTQRVKALANQRENILKPYQTGKKAPTQGVEVPTGGGAEGGGQPPAVAGGRIITLKDGTQIRVE